MANLKSLQKRFNDIQEDVPDESDIEKIMSQEAKEHLNAAGAIQPVGFPNVLSLATEEFDDVDEASAEETPEASHDQGTEQKAEAAVPARPDPPAAEKEEPLPEVEAEELSPSDPEVDSSVEEKPQPAPVKKRQPRGIPRTAAPVAGKSAPAKKPKADSAELIFFKEISAKIIAEAKETIKPEGIDSDLYWDRILDIIENH